MERSVCSISLCLLLAAAASGSLASITASNGSRLSMGCACGEAKVGRKHRRVNDKTSIEAQVRIVNGYEPHKRPWMVFIQVLSRGENEVLHIEVLV